MNNSGNKNISSLVGNYAPIGPIFTHGKGAVLYGDDGTEVLDFAGGIAVSALGHGNDKLASAIGAQARRLVHVSNLYQHDRLESVANRLVNATGMKQVFFSNSGAEANECALKIARKRGVAIHPEKYRVISLTGSFHGRIGLALAASGQPKLWQEFGPQPPGFTHVPAKPAKLTKAFDNNVCAAIVEPIQGEAGVIKIDEKKLLLLRKLCDQHDALLIMDEIQTGMGRTGSLLATPQKIKPDIITLAKGLGGGMPVGATLVAGEAVGVLEPGDHGTTYGGNPVSLAAIDTVLDHVTDNKFLANVCDLGRRLFWKLQELDLGDMAPFVEVRGKGLMAGVRLDEHRCDPKKFQEVVLEHGRVLLAPAGDNVIRILPPLNITREELDEGLRRIEEASYKIPAVIHFMGPINRVDMFRLFNSR